MKAKRVDTEEEMCSACGQEGAQEQCIRLLTASCKVCDACRAALRLAGPFLHPARSCASKKKDVNAVHEQNDEERVHLGPFPAGHALADTVTVGPPHIALE